MPPLVRTIGISKHYPSGGTIIHAVSNVSLSIEHGEFVAIRGRSGSGKSTLMSLLGLLERPDSGEYALKGREVAKLGTDTRATIRNQDIGFIFQLPALLPRATALENVELPTVYAGISPDERTKRAMEALTRVGLAERAGHHPSQLSGGQQQRVAIARGLVNRPSILLADEPTGNLDSRTSVEIMDILQTLNNEQGLTIVLVTHEPDIAQYARRNLLFRDGKLKRDIMEAFWCDWAARFRHDQRVLSLLQREGPVRATRGAARACARCGRAAEDDQTVPTGQYEISLAPGQLRCKAVTSDAARRITARVPSDGISTLGVL